jgi:formylmethanofuran dehydrogenase subunit E
MLPIKVDQRKGKTPNVFGELFGDKSLEFAIDLLNDALESESDVEVKAELERRLKLIDPNQITLIKCSKCKKPFQPRKIRKYNKNFCDSCLKSRYSQPQY